LSSLICPLTGSCCSAARFSQDLSIFTGLDDTDSTAVDYVTRLVDFFSVEYLQILETTEYHIIYRIDIRVPREPVTDTTYTHGVDEFDVSINGSWAPIHGGSSTTSTTTWSTELTTRTDMHGFDQIITLTHQSINEQFRALLRTERELLKWNHESFFTTTFGPLNVRLLSNERAIVWVHLEEAQLKTLLHGRPYAE